MKKMIIFLLSLTFFVSCNKEDLKREDNKVEGNVAEKVNKWLDKQMSTTVSVNGAKTVKSIGPNKAANIELLKQNLNFTSAKIQEKDKNYDLLIIPVNEEFKIKKNVEKTSILNLLLVLTKTGSIISGDVIYYTPKDGKQRDALLPQTIPNIYNNKPVIDSGMFKFTSVSGTLKYQVEYKNGKIWSYGQIITINSTNANGAKKSTNANLTTCIDWFLVTTYYYLDGSTYQTSEYVGTTCYGCDDPNVMSLCPDTGGGGGGGGGDGGIIVETEPLSVDVDDENMLNENDPSLTPPSGPSNNYSAFDRIQYTHYADLSYSSFAGIRWVSDVTGMSTNIKNAQSNFVASDGDAGVRKLTLLAQVNRWLPFTVPFALLSWKCDVHGLYQSYTGSSWTVQWTHEHVEVR